ncbi:hypothetical protein BDW66DRAFT_9414 [Aspergillus desertorum]
MHIFMFGHYQGGDGPDVAVDDVQPYQNYYAMNNTLLDAESFAVRFLAYLSSLSSGSDSEKAFCNLHTMGPHRHHVFVWRAVRGRRREGMSLSPGTVPGMGAVFARLAKICRSIILSGRLM